MSLQILTTKLFIPPLRQQSVLRPHLLQKLDEGLKNHKQLILVSAPPGFGKTSLVSEWANQTALKTAWLGLDESDNDPGHFWRYIVAALQTISPEIGQGVVSGFQAPQPPPLLDLITGLINDLSRQQMDILLILDDYHLIEVENIHETFNFFIDHLPPNLYLAVCARSDPPLQLSRRRGRGLLCEIRAADLRFSLAETNRLLNETLHLELSEEDILSLEHRTEGWVAGLQMAGLSLSGIPDKRHFIEDFSGDDRYVADYLLEEVLRRQPQATQNFLLKTSILGRLNASLCEAVTGEKNSQNLLAELERANLFLFPLDNHREWFRYHHLFASLLEQHFQKNEGKGALNLLRMKASQWYEEHHFYLEAIEMCFYSQDMEEVAHLLDKYQHDIFQMGELVALLKWGGKIPEQLLRSYPKLIMGLAWAASATQQSAQTQLYCQMIESIFDIKLETFLQIENLDSLAPLQRSAMIEVAVLNAPTLLSQFTFPLMMQMGQRALPYLTPEYDQQPYLFNPPSQLRPPLVYLLGYTNFIAGNTEQANALLNDAVESAILQGNTHIVALSMAQLGTIQMAQGSLQQAKATFQKAADTEEKMTFLYSPYFSQSWHGLALLAYEANDLKQTEEYCQRALKLAKSWESSELLFPVYVLMARHQVLAGNWTEVDRNLQCIKNLSSAFLKTVSGGWEVFQAWVELKRGHSGQVLHWVETFNPAQMAPIDFFQEIEEVNAARLMLAANHLEEASRLVENRLPLLKNTDRTGHLIEFMAVESVLRQAQNRLPEAEAAVKQALELAESRGYLRVFLDEGPKMHELLAKTQPSFTGSLRIYTQRLLDAFPQKNAPVFDSILPPDQSLIEPLSEREIEVLRLISSGVSNADIASQLFISVNTVKKHITNIFNKLGVENRVLAIEKSRQLKLL